MRVLLGALILCSSLHAAGPCNNGSIKGDYGLQFSGTRPSGPGGPIENFVGLVFRRYDGNGNFTETHTIKGAVAGVVLDESGMGTYQINVDCSGSTTILPVPSRPFPIIEKLIIVDDGDEILGMSVEPALLLTTSHQKKVASDQGRVVAAINANVAALARRLGLVPNE